MQASLFVTHKPAVILKYNYQLIPESTNAVPTSTQFSLHQATTETNCSDRFWTLHWTDSRTQQPDLVGPAFTTRKGPFQPEQLYNFIIIKTAHKQKEPVLFIWYTEEVFTGNTSKFLSNKKDVLSQTILTTINGIFMDLDL